MLIYNMYGNVLYQQIKGDCEADWTFKAYMVILLIAVYCGVFLYAIFAASLRECLKRYYIIVYNLQEYQVEEYMDREDEAEGISADQLSVNLIKGKSWNQ